MLDRKLSKIFILNLAVYSPLKTVRKSRSSDWGHINQSRKLRWEPGFNAPTVTFLFLNKLAWKIKINDFYVMVTWLPEFWILILLVYFNHGALIFNSFKIEINLKFLATTRIIKLVSASWFSIELLYYTLTASDFIT